MKKTNPKEFKLYTIIFILVLTISALSYFALSQSGQQTNYNTVNYNPQSETNKRPLSHSNEVLKHGAPFTSPSFKQRSIVKLDGDGEMLLTNPSGEKIGFADGHYIDEMSDAELMLNMGENVDIDQYYNFSQDSDLKVEITGTAVGTYDLVKMKGDEIIRVLNVPTAEKVKDTIRISDDRISITFANDLSRSGAYNMDVTKNQAGVSQFEGTKMPVLSGATITYKISWDTLRAGQNGVTIDIDKNGDGTIDSTSIEGAKFDGGVQNSIH